MQQARTRSSHSSGSGVAEVQTLFAKPPDDSRVLMRWWWFGPSVTKPELGDAIADFLTQ